MPFVVRPVAFWAPVGAVILVLAAGLAQWSRIVGGGSLPPLEEVVTYPLGLVIVAFAGLGYGLMVGLIDAIVRCAFLVGTTRPRVRLAAATAAFGCGLALLAVAWRGSFAGGTPWSTALAVVLGVVVPGAIGGCAYRGLTRRPVADGPMAGGLRLLQRVAAAGLSLWALLLIPVIGAWLGHRSWADLHRVSSAGDIGSLAILAGAIALGASLIWWSLRWALASWVASRPGPRLGARAVEVVVLATLAVGIGTVLLGQWVPLSTTELPGAMYWLGWLYLTMPLSALF